MSGKENTNHQKPPASSRLVELGGFEPPTFCLPGLSACDSESALSAQADATKAPSLTSPDSYNKHRPIPRVPAAETTSTTSLQRRSRSSFPAPARKVRSSQAFCAGRGGLISSCLRVCRKGEAYRGFCPANEREC